jgi:hypothetical protein
VVFRRHAHLPRRHAGIALKQRGAKNNKAKTLVWKRTGVLFGKLLWRVARGGAAFDGTIKFLAANPKRAIIAKSVQK